MRSYASFFTTESTAPPVIPLLLVWGSWVLLILMAVWASLRYYQNEQFRKIFLRNLQIFKLICLYIWYFAFQLPWSNSFPLYHWFGHVCCLALARQMEEQAVLCLDGSQWGIFALGYPVFGSLYLPSYYELFFSLGHYCLFG